ncbi:putative Mn2+ efflux pump MntP [Salibacterium salarium]|uniref:manganese efflux pump MntP n=1 Tax=Salibacterium salarium TaxID=284579 RepID=UPI0027806CFD|nr:manganese efflux pump [Salibacterium salarium]MDQ0297815.1 putative Mn2+ efflux pump MntP [Salibacterium salarium]
MEGWIVLSGMALALSMDAFSMSLAVAMKKTKYINKATTAFIVGFFHMMMPCLGLYGGRWIATSFEKLALITGGCLLLIVGLQMMWSGAKHSEESDVAIIPRGIGVLFFSLLVSLDSFSIGITLGILNTSLIKVLLLFGMFSAGLTWIGLTVGGRLQHTFGQFGEIFGGMILLIFGLKLIL